MSEGLKGSSPRKLIKRTHNRNPTFHSFHVSDILSFDLVPENQKATGDKGKNEQFYSNSKQDILNKYLISAGRSKKMDSLYQAEQDYAKKKMRNPVYFSNEVVKDSGEILNLQSSRSKSISAFLGEPLNFKSVAQILVKQSHGYNIISGK